MKCFVVALCTMAMTSAVTAEDRIVLIQDSGMPPPRKARR
jgi:hypothetical protein